MTIHLYCIPFIKVSVYKTESILQQHCMVLKVYWHTVTQTAINWSLMQNFSQFWVGDVKNLCSLYSSTQLEDLNHENWISRVENY